MFWFFKKNNNYEPGIAVEEKAEEKFARIKKSRFIPERNSSYITEIHKHNLTLRFLKKNLFAWCESRFFSCTDFIAEADFSFETEGAYTSAGVIFRKGSEFNYYYFLVSNRGYFRIDCVFNGKPMPLVEWTALSTDVDKEVFIKIVGLGGYFNFHVNGEKVCSLHDEVIGKGDITFCGQNYDSSELSEVSLSRFLVNSVSFDVESAYSDENDISTDQKYSLAKSLFERGKFETAAVWMENIIRSTGDSDLPASFFTLYGEILLNLGMYDDALKCFDRALCDDPGDEMIILEKGNLLYQQGRYLDLLEFLDKNKKYCFKNPVFQDLNGHASYFLGRYSEALEYYMKASEYDPDNPLYIYNAGKCSEQDDVEEAAGFYKKALSLFYRQDSLEDVENLLSWFDSRQYEDSDVESIRGKLYFSSSNFEEAEKVFEKLIEKGQAESEIYYLNALLMYRKGEISESIENLKTSCSMESGFALYYFRLAEYQFAASLDPSEALEKALSLDPDDEWINNLAGVIYLEQDNLESALRCFEKAFGKKSDLNIVLNFSEALIRSEDYEKALSVLETVEETPEIIIRKGEVFSSSGRYEEASEYLESAYKDDPENMEIIKKLAEVCYESEKLSRCEELLYLLEEKTPDSIVYNMIGNTAKLKGEFSRAEAAYLRSLELDFNPVVVLNYIEGLCDKQDYTEAYKKINEYLSEKEIPESLRERYDRIYSRICREAEVVLSCSNCEREWKILKNAVMNKPVRIVGEPDPASPAGKCPSCGKIFCVECAMQWLEGQRFTCPDCREYLKLNDDHLRYLVFKYAENITKSQLS